MDDLDRIILKGGRPSGGNGLAITGGILTRNPNLRYLPNGTAACDFGIEFQDPKWDPHPLFLSKGIVWEPFFCKHTVK